MTVITHADEILKKAFVSPKDVEDHHIQKLEKEERFVESHAKHLDAQEEKEGRELRNHAVKLL